MFELTDSNYLFKFLQQKYYNNVVLFYNSEINLRAGLIRLSIGKMKYEKAICKLTNTPSTLT